MTGNLSSLRLNPVPSCIHTTFSLSSDPLTDTSFVFHILAAMNDAIMNMGFQMSPQHTNFISFGDLPGSGIADSSGSSVFGLFKKSSILLSQWLWHIICSPTNTE